MKTEYMLRIEGCHDEVFAAENDEAAVKYVEDTTKEQDGERRLFKLVEFDTYWP